MNFRTDSLRLIPAILLSSVLVVALVGCAPAVETTAGERGGRPDDF